MNSLNAIDLIRDLRSRGMALATVEGRLCIEGKDAEKLSDMDRERIRNLKEALIAELESASEEQDEERLFQNKHSINQGAEAADGTTNHDKPEIFEGTPPNLITPPIPASTAVQAPSAVPCCGVCEHFETPRYRATPRMTYGCCMATPYDRVLMPKWPDDRPRRGRCPSFRPQTRAVRALSTSPAGQSDSATSDELICITGRVQYPDDKGRVKCVYCVRLRDGICMISQEFMFGISLLWECPKFEMREPDSNR